jgi:DNA primase
MNDNQQPTIREIKAAHPLQEIVPRYSDVRLSGDHLVGRCPFHDDRSPSFAVWLRTQTWQCFAASCGLGGDVIDFIGHATFGRGWNNRDRIMFKEALERLTGRGLPPLRRTIPPDWRRPEAWRPIELTPRTQMMLHTAASLYHTTLLARGRGPSSPYAYLRDERGFTDEAIRREGIGYAEGGLLLPALEASGFSRREAEEIFLLNPNYPNMEWLAGRIVFPERDRSGRILHLIGRRFAAWMRDDALKYLSLKEMTKPLYGYAQLDKRPGDNPVILVESPPDRIMARQWGYDAIANIGTKMKFDHAARLAVLRRPLAIIPHNDDDPAKGWVAAERWKDLIGHGTLVPLPEDVKDIGELGVLPDGERLLVERMRQFGFERKAAPTTGRRPPSGLGSVEGGGPEEKT